MSLEYIRKYYGVPARRFTPVVVQGSEGIIVGSRGQYIRVRHKADDNTHTYHPTDSVIYKTANGEQGDD